MDRITATYITFEAKAAENSGGAQKGSTSIVVVLFQEDTSGDYTLTDEEAA